MPTIEIKVLSTGDNLMNFLNPSEYYSALNTQSIPSFFISDEEDEVEEDGEEIDEKELEDGEIDPEKIPLADADEEEPLEQDEIGFGDDTDEENPDDDDEDEDESYNPMEDYERDDR